MRVMSNLKFFLWNNKTSTSIKNKYNNKQFRLNEWPDFGFVGCPKDYIVLSAYLMKQTLSYEQIKSLVNQDESTVNHFLYVCRMLCIIQVSDQQQIKVKDKMLGLLANDFSSKLRKMFF